MRQTFMRRTAWIWAVGSAAWTFDAILAFALAIMFGIAWAFYSQQKR
jgi:hypothetical protein